MLPLQCWSSCYLSSQDCSASWTMSTSVTPPWRRRWPWLPSCRTCSPSQVSHQHSARSSSRAFSNSPGPAGRRKPKLQGMALSTSHGLPFGPSAPQPRLCSVHASILNPHRHTHNAHATHTHMHITYHTHAHNTFSHATHTHSSSITDIHYA